MDAAATASRVRGAEGQHLSGGRAARGHGVRGQWGAAQAYHEGGWDVQPTEVRVGAGELCGREVAESVGGGVGGVPPSGVDL